jgi:hypothetical protein
MSEVAIMAFHKMPTIRSTLHNAGKKLLPKIIGEIFFASYRKKI